MKCFWEQPKGRFEKCAPSLRRSLVALSFVQAVLCCKGMLELKAEYSCLLMR